MSRAAQPVPVPALEGTALERPHPARALRGGGRDRLSGSAHQCGGVLLPVVPVVVRVVPPMALVLSGLNLSLIHI